MVTQIMNVYPVFTLGSLIFKCWVRGTTELQNTKMDLMSELMVVVMGKQIIAEINLKTQNMGLTIKC